MELTRRSIYPSHKVDLPEQESEEIDCDDTDAWIKLHYFDMPNDSEHSIKKKFVPLSKPHEVQRKCVVIFWVNESKITAFVKLGIFDDKKGLY